MPSWDRLSRSGDSSGLDLGQEALMHGIGPQPAVDLVRTDQDRCHAGIDLLLGKTPGGVFGQNQLENFPLRIGAAPW